MYVITYGMDIIHINDKKEGYEYWPLWPVINNFMLDEAPL